MEINFNTKKTEFDWIKTFDNFWLKFTDLWFKWLEWIIIVGAISYLSESSTSIILKMTEMISYLSLFFYFQSFFY